MKWFQETLTIALFVLIAPVFGRLTEDSIFMNSLMDTAKYDKRIRPLHCNGTLNITIRMTIVSFGSVEEMNNEFSLDMFFHQSWEDPRLRHNFNDVTLTGTDKSIIWLPDTFFTNIIDAQQHVVPYDNSVAVINKKGQVGLSTRITLKASCEMDLRKYPLDSQTCALQIMSYAYSHDDIDYYWKGDKEKSIDIMNDHLSQLAFVGVEIKKKIRKFGSVNYTELLAIFKYHRRLGFSFLQIYAPTFLIVCLSWLSFWISKDSIPARIALNITSILTIVTLNGSFRSAVPKVSYIKAMDLYLIVSFFFVFGAVLEYIAVLNYEEYVRNKKSCAKEHDMESDNDDDEPLDMEAIEEVIVSKKSENSKSYSLNKRRNKLRSNSRKARDLLSKIISVNSTPIDKISKIAFPCFYGTFNIVYWLYYYLSEH